MKKVVVSSSQKFLADQKSIERSLAKLDQVLNLGDRSVEIFLIGDAFMTKNVLSFEAPKDFPHPESKKFKPLGEIYLNPKYIRENNEDLAHMLVHGLLHLMGYDHKSKSDRMKMEAEEQRLCLLIKS